MSDLGHFDRRGAIGDRLRTAREARGLTLDEVAIKTRVPIRHLHAIEAGDWDALPAITYSVGFVKSYANAVGLNGSEIGQELRQHLGTASPVGNAPYEPADPARVPPRSLAIAAGLLALLLAVGYLIWRSTSVDEPDMLEVATAEEPAPAPVAAPAPQPVAPAVPSGPVILTAVSDVWLRVHDAATNTTFHQGALKAGERVEVPPTAQQPQIRTARAEALAVQIGATQLPRLAPPGAVSGLSLRPQDLLAASQAPAPGAAVLAAPIQPTARPGRPAAAPNRAQPAPTPPPAVATPAPAPAEVAAPPTAPETTPPSPTPED
jgi:transcriptional regulator with XRE-family HTH domain